MKYILKIKEDVQFSDRGDMGRGWSFIESRDNDENEIYMISPGNDGDDWAVNGEYVDMGFVRCIEQKDIDPNYIIPEELLVSSMDVITFKDTSDVPYVLRGKNKNIKSIEFNMIQVSNYMYVIKPEWIDSIANYDMMELDYVEIKKTNSSMGTELISNIEAGNYIYQVRYVNKNTYRLRIMGGGLADSEIADIDWVDNIIPGDRRKNILKNKDKIYNYIINGGKIAFLSLLEYKYVNKYIYNFHSTYNEYRAYDSSGSTRAFDGAKILPEIIEDYSFVWDSNLRLENMVFIEDENDRLCSASCDKCIFKRCGDSSGTFNFYSNLSSETYGIVKRFTINYLQRKLKYSNQDNLIIDLDKLFVAETGKAIYNKKDNKFILEDKREIDPQVLFSCSVPSYNENYVSVDRGYLVKLKPEWFQKNKLFGVSKEIKAHADSVFTVVKDMDMNDILIFNGYENLRVPRYAVQSAHGLYEFLGEDFKRFINNINADIRDTKVLSDILYPEIDGDYMQYIEPSKIEKFNGYFWNKELRDKYCSKKKIRKVLIPMIDIIDNDNVDEYLTCLNMNPEVEILSGEEIYNCFNSAYLVMESTQGASCMIDEGDDRFELYYDHAKIAVIKNKDGLIVARSVLWDMEGPDGRCKIMDRTYYSKEMYLIQMRSWARHNGYYILEENSYNCEEFISPSGDNVNADDYRVYVGDCLHYDEYPFMDTFCINIGRYLYPRGEFAKQMQDTCGGCEEIEY